MNFKNDFIVHERGAGGILRVVKANWPREDTTSTSTNTNTTTDIDTTDNTTTKNTASTNR